jgi:polyphenol oxidase
MRAVEVIRAEALAGVAHGFLGRRGGVSEGIYAGLNVGLGSDDNAAAVRQNRARAVAAVLPDAQLMTLHQVHSADVVTVAKAIADDARPKADALVTNQPGLLLGILTADCTPILLADVQAGVVGAAHAGWKGALGGVGAAVVAAMEALGADRSRIVAAIGPCIARVSYEVDESFFRRFAEHDPENERFFSSGREGHHQFDLEGYNVYRLAEAGVGRIEALGLDTYSDPDRFFSYRRTTHAGEADYGRQISVIGLRA